MTLDKHIPSDIPRLRPDIVHYEGIKQPSLMYPSPLIMAKMLFPRLPKQKSRNIKAPSKPSWTKATQMWSSFQLLSELLVHGIPRTKWCLTDLAYLRIQSPHTSILLSGCDQRILRHFDGTSNWPPTVLTNIEGINNLTA